MDFGIKDGVEVGNENSMGLIQGVDDKCARSIDVFELDQSNLVLIVLKLDSGLFGLSVLVEEVAFLELVTSEEESLFDCNPLFTIIPSGLALLMEVYNDTEILDLEYARYFKLGEAHNSRF